MNRLIEDTVFSGFVIACRFATWPTRISPSFVNPATPATTELVVPRSMPITFAMLNLPSLNSCGGAGGEARSAALHAPNELQDVDLDFLRLFPVRPGFLYILLF